MNASLSNDQYDMYSLLSNVQTHVLLKTHVSKQF